MPANLLHHNNAGEKKKTKREVWVKLVCKNSESREATSLKPCKSREINATRIPYHMRYKRSMSEESHTQTPEKTSRPDHQSYAKQINHRTEGGNLLDANKRLAMLIIQRKSKRKNPDSPAVPMQMQNYAFKNLTKCSGLNQPTRSYAVHSLLALLTSILQACWASVFRNSLPILRAFTRASKILLLLQR